MADFERKKAIREAYGISQDIDPTVCLDGSGEIVVIPEVKAVTIKDAIRVLDHVKANTVSRKKCCV
jgi:hypothetical protein